MSNNGTNDDHTGTSVRQGLTSADEEVSPGAARDLSELARELQAGVDITTVMQRVVDAAASDIPGASGAAITLLEHGRISSPVHTDDRATRVGQAQRSTGEGPCVDTARDEITIRCDDLRADPRWPAFGPIAVSNGVLSMLSFQLFAADNSMGALDVYGDEINVFTRQSEDIGLMLAAHAALAMAASRKITNLHTAVESRDVIGQAKGILMERFKIDGPAAFNLLVTTSQRRHVKIRAIADDLVTSGELRLPH